MPVSAISHCSLNTLSAIKNETENNAAPTSLGKKIQNVNNVSTAIRSGLTCLWQSIPVRAAKLLIPWNINIAQFGPQGHVFGHDFKFTSTAVCTTQNVTCFPLHFEYGYSLSEFLDCFPAIKSYGLIVNQCGWRHEFNNSCNPTDWSCFLVTEKLEHLEVSYPYAEIDVFSFKGSVQGIIAIECGKTSTYSKEECLKMAPEVFCRLPLTLPELIYKLSSTLFSTSTVEKDESSAITDQPQSIKPAYSLTDVTPQHLFHQSLAKGISKTVIDAVNSGNSNQTYWFGLAISLADINTAHSWGSKELSFSLQWTNYPRKNFMMTWQNGNFSLPGNLVELFEILTMLWGSTKKIEEVMNNSMNKASIDVENAPLDNNKKSMALKAISKLRGALNKELTARAAADNKVSAETGGSSTQAAHPEISRAGLKAETSSILNIAKVMPSHDDSMPSLGKEMRPRSNTMRKRTSSFISH